MVSFEYFDISNQTIRLNSLKWNGGLEWRQMGWDGMGWDSVVSQLPSFPRGIKQVCKTTHISVYVSKERFLTGCENTSLISDGDIKTKDVATQIATCPTQGL